MKPNKEKFREMAAAAHGNYSRVADAFGVSRQTVHNWCKEDPDFKEIMDDQKMRLYDSAIEAARALTTGIPKIVNGKLVGWYEKPDGNMVRYILSTLGKDEGFTERKEVTGANGASFAPKVINLVLDDGENGEQLIGEVETD